MTDWFEGFEIADIDTGGARIRYRHGGSGPPLLLLHGNPQTHVCWHAMAGDLARRFHVVAADLRGYGDSSAPPPGERCTNYSFRAMALDQVELMRSLGYDRFNVAGHDRGARTAHRMVLDHPTSVGKLALLDILPSRHIWDNASREWALKSWHWMFMAQGGGVPERMLEAVPARWFVEQKIGKPGIGLAAFDPRALEEYVRCFTAKTIMASCADYRACATIDLEHDRADAARRIECPTLILWGAQSHTETVFGDMLAVWRQYADDVRGAGLDCGHYLPEERARETLHWFTAFFSED